MKITRTLFNPYNQICEVYFEDGRVIEGTYVLETRNQKDSGIIGVFLNIMLDEKKYSITEYREAARKSILEKLSVSIQNIVLENYTKKQTQEFIK